MKTKNPEPTVEEQLAEARAEITRLETRLQASDRAVGFWVKHYLAYYDGKPCKVCKQSERPAGAGLSVVR
jgi:hypothetical protein